MCVGPHVCVCMGQHPLPPLGMMGGRRDQRWLVHSDWSTLEALDADLLSPDRQREEVLQVAKDTEPSEG